MTLPSISLESTVVATNNLLSSPVAEETVILQMQRGEYFGLNELGSFIWRAIQKPARIRTVRDAIVEEYEVSESECERDLLLLLGDMVDAGLATVVSGSENDRVERKL